MSLIPSNSISTASDIYSIQLCQNEVKPPDDARILNSVISVVQTASDLSNVQQRPDTQINKGSENRCSSPESMKKEQQDATLGKGKFISPFSPSNTAFSCFVESPTVPCKAQDLIENMSFRSSNIKTKQHAHHKKADVNVKLIDNITRKFLDSGHADDKSYSDSDKINRVSTSQSMCGVINEDLIKLLPTHGKAALSCFCASLDETCQKAWRKLHPGFDDNSLQARQFKSTQDFLSQLAESHIESLTDPNAGKATIQAYSSLLKGIISLKLKMVVDSPESKDESLRELEKQLVNNTTVSDGIAASKNPLLVPSGLPARKRKLVPLISSTHFEDGTLNSNEKIKRRKISNEDAKDPHKDFQIMTVTAEVHAPPSTSLKGKQPDEFLNDSETPSLAYGQERENK
ncbi:hypothetical protein [Erwinia pyrifoliae]|uniref:hypothetical protein n=1 Tax=Erwinia pyrifoliae TaxID=79967 RepID=UPI00223B3880|nr:hypothetical protein [Erwinia pyrifoliae]MCT2387381.1 hypothetical protein [Erwinia pyrifoliae]MCU8587019.1 hypothetical protein [Erwinia pyrifoliae]